MRGSAYVADIQERISKITAEEDYVGSVNKDLELIKQIDSLKQEHNTEKQELLHLKKENNELKNDVNKLN